jgi:signal transduction histidine kinase
MTPEVLSRIREPYFTTRQATGGTGLGLATVSRILKEHLAVMSVESKPGEGSCFHIQFACPRIG